jgi:hypothetical protein
MTVLATRSEIIVLNAAIQYYIQNVQFLPSPYKDALPLLRQFQQRLVETLPSTTSQEARIS